MTARPPIPKPPYTGGCLCRAVRYELFARPLAVNACHCNDCKKTSGGTNVLMLIADAAAFSASGETHTYLSTADSGRVKEVKRCAHCGVRVWHQNLASPVLVFISAGTLDDTSWAVPASHIWVECVSPGVVMQEDAIKVEGQPADRKILMDAFSRIYGDAP